MRASAIEFRLRMLIMILIVFVGFWSPWFGISTGGWDLGQRISTLEWIPLELSRLGLTSFAIATPIVIVCGALIALAGAILRVWGTAYLGWHVTVHHGDMQSRRSNGRRALPLRAQSPLPKRGAGWCT